MKNFRQAVARLLLLVYVPLTIALPLFHHHGMERGSDTYVYKATGKPVGYEGHSDDCDACKFASSHSLSSNLTWFSAATEVPIVVIAKTQQPVRTPNTLHPPRAPPLFS